MILKHLYSELNVHFLRIVAKLHVHEAANHLLLVYREVMDTSEPLREYELHDVVNTGLQVSAGAYGQVLQVTVHGVKSAAKAVHAVLREYYSTRFIEECILSSKLRHPNIVQFLGVHWPDKTRPKLPWLIMEYLPFDLHSFLERPVTIPISVRVSLLLDICNGLSYLHNYPGPFCDLIIHCNISATNVLISSSLVAKICDFGSSVTVTRALYQNFSPNPGVPVYMPPEAFGTGSEYAHYDSKLDVFSFGVIVLFMVTRKFPSHLLPSTYSSDNRLRTEIERRAKYFEMVDQSPDRTIKALADLSKICLNSLPSRRPTANELVPRLLELKRQTPDDLFEMDKLQLMMIVRDLTEQCEEEKREREKKSQQLEELLTKIETEEEDSSEEDSDESDYEAQEERASTPDSPDSIAAEERESTPASPETIATAIGIDSKQLDQPCSEDLLFQIARLLPNWLEYADLLKLTPQEVNGINTDLELTYAMRAYVLLKTWYRKNAYTDQCHYRVLVKASCVLGHADVAGRICQLIKTTDIVMEKAGDASVLYVSKDLALFKKKTIGGGAFGTILRGEIHGRPCALKVLHATATEINMSVPATEHAKSDTLERFKQECEYLESFKHPNIVEHLATRTHTESGQLVLALELMDCNLRQFFSSPSGRKSSCPTQKSLCCNVASALAYIHSRHIVHRDLCSENVLLDTKQKIPIAKLCDFGMSRIIRSEETSNSLPAFGHRGYLPPEATKVDSRRFDSSFDMFQFGVVMVQIVRRLPTIKNEKERNYELSRIKSTHPLRSLIDLCLLEDRDSRPSALQLESELPWTAISEYC